MGRRLGGHAVAVAAALLLACAQPPTELVVVIESEVAGLDQVAIEVAWDGAVVVDQDVALGPGGTSLPLTLGLRPRAADATEELRVRAIGRTGGVERVRASARTRFVAHARRVLVVVLRAACVGVGCEENQTCGASGCGDDWVDPARLPPYDGVVPDAGIRAVDVDAGRRDAGPRDAGPRDAGRDGGPIDAGCAGDASTTGAPPGCVLTRWPARPICGDRGDDGIERSFALLEPSLDHGSEVWRTLGFDLDGLCTDPLAETPLAECETPSGSSVADGPGGIDNAVGAELTNTLLAFYPSYVPNALASIRRGHAAMVITITEWSGAPDDPQVRVRFANAVDVVPAEYEPPDAGIDPLEARPDPRWDGTDVAYLSATYFGAGADDEPLVADDNAYVAGGVLVARMPDRSPFDIPVTTADALLVSRLLVTEPRLVATLSPDGTDLASGFIVGRIARGDLLAYLEHLTVCPDDPETAAYHDAVSELIERTADVRATPGTGGPGVSCDALSFALPWVDAAPVTVAGVLPHDLLPRLCP